MDFQTALNFVLRSEGGMSDDPADRGGKTNFGISSKAHPDVDVTTLTKDKAAHLYKTRYWDAIGADTLPQEMKLVAFDAAVNHGVPLAKQMIEASGGDTNKLLQSREAVYRNLVKNDPSQAKFANGWSNRLNAVAATAQPATELEKAVASLIEQRVGDQFILSKLAKAGHAAEIEFATQQGYTPAEIVARFGGAQGQAVKAAQSKVESQGFGTNVWQGAGQALGDVASGAKQLTARATGNDLRLAELQQEQLAKEADPTRRALNQTAGATVGNLGVKAVPYVAAALIPEVGIPAMAALQGAAGAVDGALTPTTGEGQFARNVAGHALMGGGTAGTMSLVGKGLTGAASRLGTRNAEVVASRQAAADALRAEGLPVNAITLTDTGKNLAARLADNPSMKAFRTQGDEAIAGKVANGLGLNGYRGAIDSEMLNAARPGIKQALDDATNVTLTLPKSLQDDLASMLGSTGNPLTKGIASDTTVRTAAANLARAAEDGVAVSGRQLQELASELKSIAQNFNASAAERQAAGSLVGKVHELLTKSMTPEQRAAYQSANSRYANLKAVEKMVSTSGDSGVVTPRQMINAVKSGRFKTSFLKGEAPYQELAGLASDAYGPANGRGLGDLLGRAIGTGDSMFGAASVVDPTTGLPAWGAKKVAELLAGKLATSENPTIVRLLTGIDAPTKSGMSAAQRHYIAKALGASAALQD